MEEHKQQLATESALEPVSDFVELEEVVEDEDDQLERETPIKESEIEVKMKEDKEKKKKKKTVEPKRKVSNQTQIVLNNLTLNFNPTTTLSGKSHILK